MRRQLGALVFALLLPAFPVQADDIEPEPYVEEEMEEPEPVAEDEPAVEAEEADATMEYYPVEAVFDVLVIRPLMFVRLVAGCTLAGPVALLTWPGGTENVKDMMDVLVDQPYRGTFKEPLGNF